MKSISIVLFVLLVSPGFGQTSIDSGLVAFFPFCGDATDHGNNNNTGTAFGGVLFVEDRLGNPNSAAYFDGINDYILVPNSISLDTLTDSMTLACWFYTMSYYNLFWVSLLSKSIETPALRQYSIIYDKDGVISFAHTLAANKILELNQWYHIAITCKDSMINCYLDGDLIGTHFLANKIEPTNFPLNIGRDPHIVNEFHHGMIDDVRIYNRALSSAEVSEISSNNLDCSTISINQPGNYPNIKLYPNPTEGKLTIESEKLPCDFTVKVYDTSGKIVQQENNNKTIDLSRLKSGIYIVKIKTDEGLATKRIIKM